VTTRGKQVGGTTLLVQCEEPLARQAEWLLDLLGRRSAEGLDLRDGRSIQVGWTILKLRERKGGLVVCEPDYSGDPFSDEREDLTASLLVQAQQNDILKRLGEKGEAAVFQDKIVLAKGCLREQRVYLERTPGAPEGDSGWYIGPAEDREAERELEALYVYQLLRVRPALMQVLALPPGYLVVFDGDNLEAVLNDRNVNVLQPQ